MALQSGDGDGASALYVVLFRCCGFGNGAPLGTWLSSCRGLPSEKMRPEVPWLCCNGCETASGGKLLIICPMYVSLFSLHLSA